MCYSNISKGFESRYLFFMKLKLASIKLKYEKSNSTSIALTRNGQTCDAYARIIFMYV